MHCATSASQTVRGWWRETCCRNPAYAATIERIAREGTHAIYYGPIAEDIVRRVHEGEYPGTLSLSDLAHYRPQESAALCHPWQRYVICVPPPPAGGIGVLEALLLLAAHRHRQARCRRSGSVGGNRRGRAAHVRRSRPLRRRSGLRAGAGRGPARCRLHPFPRRAHRRSHVADRAAGRPRRPAPKPSGPITRSSPAAPRTSSSSTPSATWSR